MDQQLIEILKFSCEIMKDNLKSIKIQEENLGKVVEFMLRIEEKISTLEERMYSLELNDPNFYTIGGGEFALKI